MTRWKQVLTAQSNDTLETRKMLIFFPICSLIGLILLTVLGGGMLLTRKFTELGPSSSCNYSEMEAGFKPA